MATPMFIVTGFLDSGKTTMIKDTLMEQEWIEPGLTLLLLCEEGEEEYPEEYLKEKNNTETEIKKQVSLYKKLRKKAIQQFKSNCRTQVNRIKKFAPLKISAKTLGGIAIGLGISLLIDYIKDKKKK